MCTIQSRRKEKTIKIGLSVSKCRYLEYPVLNTNLLIKITEKCDEPAGSDTEYQYSFLRLSPHSYRAQVWVTIATPLPRSQDGSLAVLQILIFWMRREYIAEYLLVPITKITLKPIEGKLKDTKKFHLTEE